MELDFLDGFSVEVATQVREYLAGRRKVFEVDVAQDGTEFQRAVWDEMLKIPYGETRTYSQIARAIGRPRACRAVGTACGRNKLPIIVPCHRVVAEHGLGGYAFGLEMKKELLRLERGEKVVEG